jgi:hypothetical protein
VKKGGKQRPAPPRDAAEAAAPVSARFAALEVDDDAEDHFPSVSIEIQPAAAVAAPRLFPVPTGRSWADSDDDEEEGPTWAQRLV